MLWQDWVAQQQAAGTPAGFNPEVPMDPYAPAMPAEDPNEIQMPPVDARQEEIQMPAQDARSASVPVIGFPHDPGPGIDNDQAPPLSDAPPPVQEPADPQYATQPGTGIPVGMFDQAVKDGNAPDAISGGSTVPIAPGANEYVNPVPTGVELTDEQRARQFAAENPEDQARHEYAFAQRQQAEENRRLAQAALKDEQDALESHAQIRDAQQMAAQKTAQLDEEAKKLAETEIDTKWHPSFLQGVTGVLAGIVGGFIAQKQGGPNQALQMIDREVDLQIDAQKFKLAAKQKELARRGASINEQLALASDVHQENERFRIASYTRVQNQIASEMQNYDPRGKSAIELGKTYAAISQQRQAALVKFQDTQFANYKDALKFAADQRKADDEHRKSMLESAGLERKLAGGIGGGAAKPKEMVNRAKLAGEGVDTALLPPEGVEMTREEWDKRTRSIKGSSEASKALGESLADAVSDVSTEDGEPYRAATPEEAKALREKKAAVDSAVSIIDNVLRLRGKNGWTSDVMKSDAWQNMKTDWAQLMLQKKNIEQLGAISGSDMDLMTDALGASDPTSLQSHEAGIRRARYNTVQGFDQALNAKKRQGSKKPKPYSPPDLGHYSPPIETDTDRALKTAQKRSGIPAISAAEESGLTVQPAPLSRYEKAMDFMLEPKMVTSSETGGMSDEAKAAIDALYASEDIEKMKQAAIHAPSPGARAYAMGLAFKLATQAGAKGAK